MTSVLVPICIHQSSNKILSKLNCCICMEELIVSISKFDPFDIASLFSIDLLLITERN
jgi:hypothetical protein